MLNKNDKAPDFTLKDQHGQLFSLKENLGKKILVIYFYPKDFTPGCTREACSFRDQYEIFKEAGADVIGISSDSESKHFKFSEKYQLPYRLLADPGGKVRRKFGIKGDLLGLIPGRATFVVGKDGYIALAFQRMQPDLHIDLALKTIQKLKQP